MPLINSNSMILLKSDMNETKTIPKWKWPAMECALITLVNFMELNGFDNYSKLQLFINETEYENRYSCLYYFRYF